MTWYYQSPLGPGIFSEATPILRPWTTAAAMGKPYLCSVMQPTFNTCSSGKGNHLLDYSAISIFTFCPTRQWGAHGLGRKSSWSKKAWILKTTFTDFLCHDKGHLLLCLLILIILLATSAHFSRDEQPLLYSAPADASGPLSFYTCPTPIPWMVTHRYDRCSFDYICIINLHQIWWLKTTAASLWPIMQCRQDSARIAHVCPAERQLGWLESRAWPLTRVSGTWCLLTAETLTLLPRARPTGSPSMWPGLPRNMAGAAKVRVLRHRDLGEDGSLFHALALEALQPHFQHVFSIKVKTETHLVCRRRIDSTFQWGTARF